MNGRILKSALAVLAAATLGASSLMAGEDVPVSGPFVIRVDLHGYQEVPALSTTAKGNFRAMVDPATNTITWKLKYEALEGDVVQAHVHFGQKSVNGGISFFLCTNAGNGPVGTQLCPAAPAEITGTIVPGDVIGPLAVGIEPGAWAEIAAAIRAGIAYANVHTTKWPAGEIRGQLAN
jgi:hypothetical protein